MSFNFEMLAQETLKLSEQLSDKSPFEEERPKVSGPGVVFYLDQGISTYCMKGIPSDDLEWDQDRLEKKDPKFLEHFRLKDDWHIDQFIFYPTESLIDGEIIADQILGKRFPKEEAMLCNLSDPGFSWWLSETENSIDIFYQSQKIERDQCYLQLGPLGDSMLATRRFGSCLPILKDFFTVNEFSATPQSFHVSCTTMGQESFASFKDIFLKGDVNIQKDFAVMTTEERSFYLFIREVALLRKFWLFAQDLIS